MLSFWGWISHIVMCIHTLPIFSKKEDVILSSSYVQTVIYDPSFVADDNFFYFSPSGITIDYFPNKNNHRGGTFSYNTFVAMYYKNIAADALADKDLAKSFMYASTAYKYDTKNIETINLLAVIHRRAGDVKTAEAIYKIGIDRGKPNIALLSNYIMLLKSQQRMEEVSFLQSKMEELDDPSPYKSLTQAYVATQNNGIKQAERHFKKALKKAPYLNQAYMELYRIYIKQ
jgi:Tfp pilus assembly protein PilF